MIAAISIIVLVVLFFLLNVLYKRTNSYQNRFMDVRKYRKNGELQTDLNIVNLGSNHPKFAFDYSGLDVKGENCAVGPQTFEYDFEIIKHITPNLANGAVVVIPVCLLNFFLYRFDSRNAYLKYYIFLRRKDLHDYSFVEKLFYVDFPILGDPRLAFRIIRDTQKDDTLDFSHNSLDTEEKLAQDAKKWIKGWEQQFDIQLPYPKPSQKNQQDIKHNIIILKHIIDYCIKNGFKPVITILPVTETLSGQFSDEFIDKYILYYIDQANTTQNPVLNYLRDERFVSPDLYINSFFMNKVGRRTFTKAFIEDLKEKKII